MNLIELYLEDGGKISYNGGDKKHGSCPSCGGAHRFWMNLNLPSNGHAAKLGWFRCGQAKGSGCGIHGDAIDYLKQVRGIDFVDACEYLGVDLEEGKEQYNVTKRREKYSILSPSAEGKKQPPFQPLKKKWPEKVEFQEIWQEHAEKFVKNCHEAIQERQSALDWLAERGINLDMVKRQRIGFHAGNTIKKKNLEYQNSYRPLKSWGMREEKENQKFVLPAGIVSPDFDDTGVIRVQIRTTGAIPNQQKYHFVAGSITENTFQTIYNPGKDVVAVVESGFCGKMIAEICNNITVIVLSSASIRPCFEAVEEIRNKKLILGCFDTDDKPGKPLWDQAGAAQCLGWWPDHVPNFQPLLIPGCSYFGGGKHGHRVKDPGDYFSVGGDIAKWIEWGIKMYTPSSGPKEVVEGGGVKSVYSEVVTPINRFIRWLGRTGTVVCVGDKGRSLGLRSVRHVDEESREMSKIFFGEFDEKIVHLLADGVWSASRLVEFLK